MTGERQSQYSASGPVTLEKDLTTGCQMVAGGLSRHQEQAGRAPNRSPSDAEGELSWPLPPQAHRKAELARRVSGRLSSARLTSEPQSRDYWCL